jgi:hypothetical protein
MHSSTLRLSYFSIVYKQYDKLVSLKRHLHKRNIVAKTQAAKRKQQQLFVLALTLWAAQKG